MLWCERWKDADLWPWQPAGEILNGEQREHVLPGRLIVTRGHMRSVYEFFSLLSCNGSTFSNFVDQISNIVAPFQFCRHHQIQFFIIREIFYRS